jgi:hypothetical protein
VAQPGNVPGNERAQSEWMNMATNQGSYTDTEDFIFDHAGGDDIDSGSNLPAVREPSREVAPQPQPRETVPADRTPAIRDDEPFYEDESDSALVSDAIRDLMRPGGRGEIAVRTPVETRPAPQPAPRQEPAPRQDTQDAPLSPREQALLRDLREERRVRQELQQRLQPAQQPQQQGPDFETRFFSNPQEVLNEVTQNFAHQLATVRLENDLNLAEIRHGTDVFKTAFDSYMQTVGDGNNLALYQRVMSSESPGEEIMRWHREHTLLQETGGDVNSFREKLRQEILAELQAGGQPQVQPQRQAADAPRDDRGRFTPRHEVRLPTATSRMSGSQVAGNEDMEDGSDDAIFDAGRARSPRR